MQMMLEQGKFELTSGTVHRLMIVSVQDETKAPQPSVVQRVKGAEQRIP
jgi:hypothetical protein